MDSDDRAPPPQRHTIREEDEDDTPAWASTPPPNQAPPPTYDPSSFTSSLNSIPTFKPRKSNRISVLAYPTDGSPLPPSGPITVSKAGTLPLLAQGGPPGFIGGVGTTSPEPTSLTAPALPPPSGIKLPPPPMKGAGPKAAPLPYAKDFRTAEIISHWNDPPTQVFAKKNQQEETLAHDFGPMKETLTRIMNECKARVPVAQKRMFEDTTKRLEALQEQMDRGAIKERVVVPLGDMIQALSTRSFAECHAIHGRLMQTEFDSEGKWLLGFKRLIDLYSTIEA